MSKSRSSFSFRQAVTPAIIRFGRAVLIACLILMAGTAVADQAALPRVTGKEIQSLVTKNLGKVVLLHFWASWCPPCAHEFPDLVKLYTAHKPRGLEVIAVSMNDLSEMRDVMSFVRAQCCRGCKSAENCGEKRAKRFHSLYHHDPAAPSQRVLFNSMCLNGRKIACREKPLDLSGKHE